MLVLVLDWGVDGEGARTRAPLLLHPAPKPDDGAEMSGIMGYAADCEDAIPPRVSSLDQIVLVVVLVLFLDGARKGKTGARARLAMAPNYP